MKSAGHGKTFCKSHNCPKVLFAGPQEQGGGGEGAGQKVRQPPQSSLLMCPFLLISPLNVVFLKKVTKNIDENQQVKSRAS